MRYISILLVTSFCFILLMLCNCSNSLQYSYSDRGDGSYSINYTFIEEPSDKRLSHTTQLNLVYGEQPHSLNPYRTINNAELFLQKALFSSLFIMVPWSDFPQKNLVDRYTVSSDGREYRLVLHKEIKFSDGSDLTSQDIISSFGLLNGPLKHSSFVQQFYYSNRKLKVTALSANEISIILDKPNPHLLYALAGFPIIPAASFSHFNDPTADFNNLWRWPTVNVSGSGPYMLV